MDKRDKKLWTGTREGGETLTNARVWREEKGEWAAKYTTTKGGKNHKKDKESG